MNKNEWNKGKKLSYLEKQEKLKKKKKNRNGKKNNYMNNSSDILQRLNPRKYGHD